MILEHKQAVLDRLRTDSALANKTFDSEVKSTNGAAVLPPYCVVYTNQGQREVERLNASQTRANFTFTIHSVGTSAEQAQAVAEKVYTQLLGFKPTIAGRNCWPVRAEMSQSVRMDKDVLPPVFYAVDEFTLSSTPA